MVSTWSSVLICPTYIPNIKGKTIWTCIRSNDSPNFFALESYTLGKKKGDRLEELREYVV